MSATEYMGWIDYFKEINKEPEKPSRNLLDDPDTIVAGFGL